MKTIKTTVEKPQLEIYYDEFTDSPREWSNLGFFITRSRRYNSPDNHEQLEAIMNDTENMAKNVEQHIDLMKAQDSDILAIYPINKYEHGGVSYSIGEKGGFDNCIAGFYFVMKNNEITDNEEDFIDQIEAELDFYNKYVNGNVYAFRLYNENGELEDDNMSGFYELEDIKEYLPEEWKDEDLTDYLK